ncbi:MAG: hypothetical protein AB2385_04385 [Symbiobacterium sp.]|uniref:hypothetical protein n=1 Tax=Symbiobacterium sp. TaxID=1971213 RepID=UPI0034644503
MEHTVVGVFRHSGDADMAAAHLRDAFALGVDELEVLGEAELRMGRARAGPDDSWLLAAFAETGLDGLEGEDPVTRRWVDQVERGRTLVVIRSDDPDRATEMAGELRRAGAFRVDMILQ